MKYVPAWIEAFGVVLGPVLGALIAGGYISKMFKRDVLPLFQTYSDEKHDAHKLMRKATENIYIVASIGDRLLEKYERKMRSYLKRGVKLKFLMHEKAKFFELESYIHADTKPDEDSYVKDRTKALETLMGLKRNYPELVEIREFPLIFPASYIGIDIEENIITNEWPSHSMIQVMLYQYNVKTKDSPITYLSPKTNRKLFQRTAQCILEMWDIAAEIEAK